MEPGADVDDSLEACSITATSEVTISNTEKAELALADKALSDAKLALADADLAVAVAEQQRHQARMKCTEIFDGYRKKVAAIATLNGVSDDGQWGFDMTSKTFKKRSP